MNQGDAMGVFQVLEDDRGGAVRPAAERPRVQGVLREKRLLQDVRRGARDDRRPTRRLSHRLETPPRGPPPLQEPGGLSIGESRNRLAGVERLEQNRVLASRSHPPVSGDLAEELVGVELRAQALDVEPVLAK